MRDLIALIAGLLVAALALTLDNTPNDNQRLSNQTANSCNQVKCVDTSD